jgi:hypothetical protein
MLIYLPLLFFNKLMGWFSPAIMLTQMKYMFIYSAYNYFNNETMKKDHNELYMYFTNDPSSMGFQSTVNLTLLFLMMFATFASIGSQIKDSMWYFKIVLVFF